MPEQLGKQRLLLISLSLSLSLSSPPPFLPLLHTHTHTNTQAIFFVLEQLGERRLLLTAAIKTLVSGCEAELRLVARNAVLEVMDDPVVGCSRPLSLSPSFALSLSRSLALSLSSSLPLSQSPTLPLYLAG